MVIVRPENPGDYDAVYEIHSRAFETEAEAKLVAAIRELPEHIPALSLVAVTGGVTPIGHILFTPVTVGERDVNMLGLGPVGVLPEYQNKGIGSALVWEGLELSRRNGYQSVVLLGHASYYPRFGFVPASTFHLKSQWDVPDEAFMALELSEGALSEVGGTVRYLPQFDEV